ncbi:MAG: caspase family protein [Chloroflexi bacterium]|nr:caspase family protein [Chloroflexota bacterium]
MPALDSAHALVVGIAQYQHLSSLPPTVVKDARDVHDLLVDPAAAAYPPGQVNLLVDDQASLAGLRQALGALASSCGPDASVLLYLSSHGARLESGPHADAYILPADAQATSDAAIASTALAGAELTRLLRAIPARKLVAVFDCCHAGGIGEPKDALGTPLQPGLPESYYATLQAGQGRVIMAASRSSEFSWVLPNAENSLFTHYLLAGVRGGVESADGLVHIFDLFEYIQPRVTADQPSQHPVFKAELEDNFPVALTRNTATSKAAADGFAYDAYVSYVDRDPDSTWVWDTLVPRLEAAKLQVAVSGDVEQPGVARVVGIERGIARARRVIVVLSDAYLSDNVADFENVLAQTMGVQEGTYRVVPVRIGPVDPARLPTRLSMLTTLDLVNPRRAEREWERLIDALRGPLPGR